MKYAVIRTGGKQYKVSEGDVLEIDKIETKSGKINFEVLLFALDESIKVGTPILKDCLVSGNVLGDVKGKKIRVSKFKAKSRLRRVMGFRAQLTKIQIEKIEPVKEEKKEAAKKN